MSEPREVADTLRNQWREHAKNRPADVFLSAYCRAFVKSKMPGESETVLDRVIWNLLSER